MEYPKELEFLFISIQVLRKARAMTQKSLADAMGVGNTTISNWEKRVSTPQLVDVIRLSKVLEVSLDELVFRDLSSTPSARLTSAARRFSEISAPPEWVKEMMEMKERLARLERASQKGKTPPKGKTGS